MHPMHKKVQYDYHSTMSHVPLTIYIKLFDYLNKHNIPCKHDIDEPIFYCQCQYSLLKMYPTLNFKFSGLSNRLFQFRPDEYMRRDRSKTTNRGNVHFCKLTIRPFRQGSWILGRTFLEKYLHEPNFQTYEPITKLLHTGRMEKTQENEEMQRKRKAVEFLVAIFIGGFILFFLITLIGCAL